MPACGAWSCSLAARDWPGNVRELENVIERLVVTGRNELVKLEVLGDPHTLYPNMPETLKAAGQLVKEGFKVMVYCSDDPIQARMLEEIGCVAVMPLAAPIGSGLGIRNPHNIQMIKERAHVPVIVDAAAQLPPAENLRRFIAEGADLEIVRLAVLLHDAEPPRVGDLTTAAGKRSSE